MLGFYINRKYYKSALKYIKLAYKNDKNTNYEILIHYGDICICNKKIALAKEKWKESIKQGADLNLINKKILEFKCE